MPRLHSSREVIAALERAGFTFVSQRGSHLKYAALARRCPRRSFLRSAGEIPRGTFRSILRQSGLDADAFRR